VPSVPTDAKVAAAGAGNRGAEAIKGRRSGRVDGQPLAGHTALDRGYPDRPSHGRGVNPRSSLEKAVGCPENWLMKVGVPPLKDPKYTGSGC
jgi:hypothetical protein